MLNKMERQVLRLIESVKKPKSCLSQFSSVYEKERKEPKEDGPLDNQDEKKEQVAQGQYVVSDTRCPALSDCEFE